jgi:hypothetical protein
VTLIDFVVPSYAQMLKALSGWLDKAAKQLPDDEAEALLSARLAPDMFPLATQIRFACAQALEGMYRLKREPFPPTLEALLDEGRNAGDRPGTLAKARARIDETIALVQSLAADAIVDDAQGPIEHALPMGIVFDLTAEQYVRDWTIPQFYFHVMAAYAILRSRGVALGKADYAAHMFAHVRPGTMPGEPA